MDDGTDMTQMKTDIIQNLTYLKTVIRNIINNKKLNNGILANTKIICEFKNLLIDATNRIK